MWVIAFGGYDLEQNVCFKPMITDASREYIRRYNHYKNNILMYGNGTEDQPAKYLDAIELIEHLVNTR